jgi:type III restriction enzyme
MEHTKRMLLAIMISEYRQIVAENQLNKYIKPVILFKNPTNTDNSDKNYKDFVTLIEKLSIKDIDEVFKTSDIKMLDKLYQYIKDDKQKFVNRLKHSFNEQNLILIHSKIKNKDELMQKYLNNLEDEHNHIRVIFAVDILNEGWDVLNLYDIVKLDEAKTTGKSTISEAQLIGRGARYYPFEYKDEDKYKRKFDDINSDLNVLEEMCFYSINKSDYIDTLTKQLRKIGLMGGDDEDKIYLELKEDFKQTYLYKNGYIYQNKQLTRVKEKEVFGIDYYIKSYKNNILIKDKSSNEFLPFEDDIKDVDYKYIEKFTLIDNQDLVRIAINKNRFFYFDNMKKYFPNVKSISKFIKEKNYLADVTFSIKSTIKQSLNDDDKINLIADLLNIIQKSILKNSKKYIGSDTFTPQRISHIIQSKKAMKKIDSNSDIDIKQSWYVFNKHGGTSEELKFVEFISSVMYNLEKKYDDIKLIRNEKAFKIFSIDKNRNADRFEPDFVLMLKSKEDGCYHQIFCEPKGNHLLELDIWKEDFLEDITKLTNANKIKLECVNKDSLEMYDNDCYKLYGLPFYNDDLKDKFDDKFQELVLS